MNTLRTVLFALPLVVVSALTGCASEPAGEETAAGSDAIVVPSSEPITLANYGDHMKIAEINYAIGELEELTLTRTENPSCDGMNEKWTSEDGKIVRVKSTGGEGGFEGSTDIWYAANGKPLLGVHRELDLTGEKTKSGNPYVTEWRTYFDSATGQPVFQLVRAGEIAKSTDWAPTEGERLPEAHEVITAQSYAEPNAWFSSTGCSGAE